MSNKFNKHKKRVFMWKIRYILDEWNISTIVFGPPEDIKIIGYDFIKGMQSYRLFNNRTWYLSPHKDQKRIDQTRIWQIKNKLNYGRY